ncbi:hypothetical protein ABIF20_008018 [Bradyrhizobium japonicum]
MALVPTRRANGAHNLPRGKPPRRCIVPAEPEAMRTLGHEVPAHEVHEQHDDYQHTHHHHRDVGDAPQRPAKGFNSTKKRSSQITRPTTTMLMTR